MPAAAKRGAGSAARAIVEPKNRPGSRAKKRRNRRQIRPSQSLLRPLKPSRVLRHPHRRGKATVAPTGGDATEAKKVTNRIAVQERKVRWLSSNAPPARSRRVLSRRGATKSPWHRRQPVLRRQSTAPKRSAQF